MQTQPKRNPQQCDAPCYESPGGQYLRDRGLKVWLIVILLLAFGLRLGLALAFPNIHWADEIFQTMEPAHRLAFGNGITTWEFRVGARSWVMPAVLAGLMRLTAWMGHGSAGYLLAIKFALCALSLVPVVFAYMYAMKTGGRRTAIVAAVMCAAWYDLIYFAPKAFTEVVAAHLLLIGILALTMRDTPLHDGGWARAFNPFFVGGIFCGLALAMRIQQVPAVGLLALYCCRREWKRKWLPMLAGVAIPVVAFGAVDAFTWRYPFQSTLLIFWINIVQHKAASFGVEPWYYYVQMLWRHMWPVLLLAFAGIRRGPLLALVAAAIVVPHSMIAHKEFRLIYAALPILLTLAALGIGEISEVITAQFGDSHAVGNTVAAALLAICLVSSALLMRPKDWTQHAEGLRAFSVLSRTKDVCGVGLWGVAWQDTGGYAYLHHKVPIFVGDESQVAASETNTPDDWTTFATVSSGANYILANQELPPEGDQYQLQRCWGDTCLYRRPGVCQAIPGYDVSKLLEWNGE